MGMRFGAKTFILLGLGIMLIMMAADLEPEQSG